MEEKENDTVNKISISTDSIKHIYYKKQLKWDEFNAIIDTATNLASGKNADDARFKNIAKKIAIVLFSCTFEDEDGNVIDIEEFNYLSLNDLYDIIYLVDLYNPDMSWILQKQIQDINETLDYIWEEENVNRSLASKYDVILTQVIDLLKVISDQYKDVDIKDVSEEISTLTEAIKNVDSETLIETIIKNMKKKAVN